MRKADFTQAKAAMLGGYHNGYPIEGFIELDRLLSKKEFFRRANALIEEAGYLCLTEDGRIAVVSDFFGATQAKSTNINAELLEVTKDWIPDLHEVHKGVHLDSYESAPESDERFWKFIASARNGTNEAHYFTENVELSDAVLDIAREGRYAYVLYEMAEQLSRSNDEGYVRISISVKPNGSYHITATGWRERQVFALIGSTPHLPHAGEFELLAVRASDQPWLMMLPTEY